MTENNSVELFKEEPPQPAKQELPTLLPSEIDQLDNGEVLPVDLMSDYWSPANYGEKKKIIFDCFDTVPMVDQFSGEVAELECAFFYTKDESGALRRMRNGSKKLVGNLRNSNLKRGAPLLITYRGKTKNKNNPYMADDWSINPIKPANINYASNQST